MTMREKRLIDMAELAAEVMTKEAESCSLYRIEKQCDNIRKIANKIDASDIGPCAKKTINRIFERSLEKSMDMLYNNGFHQAEICCVQDILNHIRSMR